MIRNKRLTYELVAIMLTALLFNCVGYPFLVSMMRLHRRHEVSSKPDEADLVRFSFSSQEGPDWIEPGEFRYNGSMFDVVRSESLADQTTVYYAVHDRKEEGVFAQLERMLGLSGQKGESGGKSIRNLPPSLAKYFIPGSALGLLEPQTAHPTPIKPFLSAPVHILSIPDPPPRT